MSTAKPKTQHSSQQKAFIEAARSLGCDDDEEAFDKRLKAVASAPPPTPAKKPKTKRPVMHARTILDAITFLQSLGHDVGLTGDIPGLFHVDGREVTTNQLIDIATQAALK